MEDFFVALLSSCGSEEIEVVDADDGTAVCAEWGGQ